MTQTTQELLKKQIKRTEKAIKHLEYSFNKISLLSTDPTQMDDETLETWESFTARFSRAVDLITSQLARGYCLAHDPGFEGSLIDALVYLEKKGLIHNAKEWLEMRKLRNIAAHEYNDESLESFLISLIKKTPQVLGFSKNLDKLL